MDRVEQQRSVVGPRRVAAGGSFHHVWFWEAEALVLTDTHAPDERHRHAAVQVVVSLGEPTAMRVDDGEWCRALGTVVAGDAFHTYDSKGQPTLGLWIDPASSVGRALAGRYLANRLEGVSSLPPVADLAVEVDLSPSRLQHLVREQLGISLSRWMLWRRTLVGLELMLQGVSSTDAAVEAGFADAPDFTRRFREFLGAPPAAAIEDPRSHLVVSSRLELPAA